MKWLSSEIELAIQVQILDKFVFHFALILFGKVWIYLVSPPAKCKIW